ncbi:MAG: glycosyltransferase [Terracidiphilus sp.]|jgi:glycosyltransferase involved in cell wall biosynthesis
MRIVYLLTSLGVGGAEKQALAVSERMAKRGHTVAVLVLMPRLPEEWPTAIRTLHLDVRKTPAGVLRGFKRGRDILREFRPDLVHSHSFHANIFARLLRLAGPPFVVLSTVHNVYEGGWWRMVAYRLTDRLSHRTVAVSQAAAERFTRFKAVPSQKCSVVLNGIDVDGFVPDCDRRTRVRAEMGIAAGSAEFVWLAVGRLAPSKDYPNLLRAFAATRAKKPDAQLWVAGDARGDERAPLESLATEMGIGANVRWLGLRRDMPALLDAADAFVSASAWEGMPLAVGEAMVMEKPVVATDVGGVRELVGDAGVVVPAKDSPALAEAMLATMKESREELDARRRAARSRIVDHFSMDATANTWEALYSSLIENREPRTVNGGS